MSSAVRILFVILLFSGSSLQAEELVVPNFSFENPVFDENASGFQAATGWTSNGGGGIDPFYFGFTASDDGVQHYFLNLPDFGGPDPSFVESNSGLIGLAKPGTYSLTVAGGRRQSTTDGTYVIELRAGGVVIATEVVNDPFNSFEDDSWNDISATVEIGRDSPARDQDLTIRLIATVNSGGGLSQGQFDNVRLDFVSPEYTAVPTLSDGMLGLLALLLAILGGTFAVRHSNFRFNH